MRMMKRVAVGVLTAAMALSMLTACGGGGGNASSGSKPSGGNTGTGTGSTGTSSSSSGTTNGSTNSSSGSTDTTKLPDNSEIKYADSLTRKWNLQRSNSDKLYIKTERISNGQKIISEQAYSGKKSYFKSTYTTGDSERSVESISDGNTSYTIYPKHKIAVTYVSKRSDSNSSSSETYLLTSMKKTTCVENNVSYYTEVITYTGKTSGKVMTNSYSFDKSGKLVYLNTVYEDGTSSKVHYLAYSSSIPSSAIFDVPEGWDIYTVTYSDSDSTITAPDGHTLTNEEVSAFYRKINN